MTHEGAAIHALREQQTAPYQLLQVFDQRRDEAVDKLTDKFEDLDLTTDHGADVDIESIDTIELDTPQINNVQDASAELSLTAHITFTATATYDDPTSGIYDSEEKEMHFTETKTETVQRKVSLPVRLQFQYADIASLADLQHARILVQEVNEGKGIVFELERPEDLK
jgi:hypothetical protein